MEPEIELERDDSGLCRLPRRRPRQLSPIRSAAPVYHTPEDEIKKEHPHEHRSVGAFAEVTTFPKHDSPLNEDVDEIDDHVSVSRFEAAPLDYDYAHLGLIDLKVAEVDKYHDPEGKERLNPWTETQKRLDMHKRSTIKGKYIEIPRTSKFRPYKGGHRQSDGLEDLKDHRSLAIKQLRTLLSWEQFIAKYFILLEGIFTGIILLQTLLLFSASSDISILETFSGIARTMGRLMYILAAVSCTGAMVLFAIERQSKMEISSIQDGSAVKDARRRELISGIHVIATTVSLCCVLAMNEFVNLATYKELRDKGWYNREPIPDQLDSALQSFKDATAVTCVFIGIGWFLLVSLIRWQENYAHLEEIEREKRD
mmetsp:Transcript_16166/g.18143  ORF Transcript_16166/g.18143 Transcript_16166/m.18143 type:complete len:369 (+) Transcript_16166:137-1243(+)